MHFHILLFHCYVFIYPALLYYPPQRYIIIVKMHTSSLVETAKKMHLHNTRFVCFGHQLQRSVLWCILLLFLKFHHRRTATITSTAYPFVKYPANHENTHICILCCFCHYHRFCCFYNWLCACVRYSLVLMTLESPTHFHLVCIKLRTLTSLIPFKIRTSFSFPTLWTTPPSLFHFILSPLLVVILTRRKLACLAFCGGMKTSEVEEKNGINTGLGWTVNM